MYYTDVNGGVKGGKVAAHIAIALLVLILLFGTIGTVSAGYVGVKTRFSAVKGTLQPGLYFKMPFFEHVTAMDVQTQKEQVDSVQSASQDLQTVTTNVAVNYHLDGGTAATMYQNVGVDYAIRVIDPAIQESVKANTAKYTAEQLITQREAVRAGIISLLTEKMSPFGVTVDAVNITNFDFSTTFNDAIEKKVTAEQNALAAKNKLDQVQYEAQQRVAQAEGEAKAISIQAQAINSQGGASYVQLKAIDKWDGKLPTQFIPGQTVPFLNLTK